MAKVAQLLAAVLMCVATSLFVQTTYGATGLSDDELKTVSQEFDRSIQRYDDWLSRMYELTPDQKDQVHKHLQELKDAQLEWGPGAEKEMNEISKEMRFYIEEARQGKTLDKQKVQELQARMVGLVTKAPLSLNNVVTESEKFLPPEQVQAGRQRVAEYNDRIKEMAEQQKGELPASSSSSDMDLLKPYLNNDPMLGMPGTAAPAAQPAAEVSKSVPQAAPAVTPAPMIAAAASAPAEVESSDDWNRYVQAFIGKYQLDEHQAQQCWQIHGELKKRADEYLKAHKSDYDAVGRIDNKNLAAKELKDLNKPVMDMFGELKTRLNNIPTDEQRKVADAAIRAASSNKAVASAPSSRPTSSRPASASQPTRTRVRPARTPASRPAASAPASAPAAAR